MVHLIFNEWGLIIKVLIFSLGFMTPDCGKNSTIFIDSYRDFQLSIRREYYESISP